MKKSDIFILQDLFKLFGTYKNIVVVKGNSLPYLLDLSNEVSLVFFFQTRLNFLATVELLE